MPRLRQSLYGNPEMQAGLSLLTLKPLSAVKLQGDAIRAGRITRIPTDSMVTTRGTSRLPNMVEIEWHGERYAAFEVDLEQRCIVEAPPSTIARRRWIA
jgi:hypothetical protein